MVYYKNFNESIISSRNRENKGIQQHECSKNMKPGPEVIKLFSGSTQLSTKLQVLINTKILTNEEVSCFKSLRCCIYGAE